jgi:UDP-glucose 4-epimerase
VRALVTGGAGFIGSHVADALLARGDEVHVLDNLTTGKRDKVPAGASFAEGDIRTDSGEVFERARPEVCFHLAAQADVNTSVERPDYDADVNVVGTVRLLEAAREHGTQVVFTSTGGAMYGECDGPAPETAERNPISPYGISKLAGEEYLAGWNRLHGTHHVSLRLGNVYGARQEAGLEGGVIAIFLERMAAGQPTLIYGDGEQSRDFVYVGDVVRALIAAVGRTGGVYNIGTGTETTVTTVHELCRRVTGVDDEPEYGPARAGDVRRSVIDAGLAKREFGWQAETDLEQGLRETWEWTRANS